jgi:hypothetical protein
MHPAILKCTNAYKSFTKAKFSIMKNLILTLLTILGLNYCAFAQDEGANIVKVNLFSLPLKNINVEYERSLTRKISVALGFRYMPKGSIPFSNSIANLLNEDGDNWDDRIRGATLGNYAITPTIRFYMGRGNLRGFYVAPFARIAKYSASLNYAFEVNSGTTSRTEDLPLAGDVRTFTGGILFGSQFSLAKNLSLDWWIFGPQYGTSNGSISGKRQLSADEQRDLRDQLGEIEDLPVVKATYVVDGNGATVNFKGPWAGIRAGLALGFRF